MYSVLVFIFLVATAQAQIFSFGTCPSVSVVKPFVAASFAGTWYEVKSYPIIFEFLGKCVTAKYTANSDLSIAVENTMYNQITNQPSSINGTAYFANAPVSDGFVSTYEGDLVVNFPSAFIPYAPYKVLATDYTNYAVVYSCLSLASIGKLETVWYLNRSRNPSASDLTNSNDAVVRNAISSIWMFDRDQSNCPN